MSEKFDKINTNYKNRYEIFYFVKNYKGDRDSQLYVDSLICKNLDSLKLTDSVFCIYVFRKSKLANADRLKHRPRLIESDNWLTGEKSADVDLIQRVDYGKDLGYWLYDYNLIFTCDTLPK